MLFSGKERDTDDGSRSQGRVWETKCCNHNLPATCLTYMQIWRDRQIGGKRGYDKPKVKYFKSQPQIRTEKTHICFNRVTWRKATRMHKKRSPDCFACNMPTQWQQFQHWSIVLKYQCTTLNYYIKEECLYPWNVSMTYMLPVAWGDAEEVRRRKCRDCLTPPMTKQSNLILWLLYLNFGVISLRYQI